MASIRHFSTPLSPQTQTQPQSQRRRRFSSPKACSAPLQSQQRRQFLGQSAAVAAAAAVSISLPLTPFSAKSEDLLSEWERVYLPIDPGVVLLDIAFVPDNPDHGFLLGTRQTILETKDGGQSWVPRSISSAEERILITDSTP
ncbi:hypothetical protein RDABS01_011706 [Bienertia sinuspersici]